MPVRRCLLLLLAALLLAAPLAAAATDAANGSSGHELADGGTAPPPAEAAPARFVRALVAGPVIASVSPPIASAGTSTTITITGTGFGAQASRSDVGFPSAGGVYWASGRTNAVNPNEIVNWSDTEIKVRVPNGLAADGTRTAASSGGIRVVTDANLTSNAVPFAVSFGVAGKKWAAPPVFVVNDNCPGVTGGAAAVRRAVATWNTALPADLQIDSSGTSNGTEAVRDGRSLIAWGPSGPVTNITYYYENEAIVEADIILSTSYAWTAGEAGGSVLGIEPVTLRNLAFCLGIAWLAGIEPQGPSDAAKAGCQYRTDALGNMNLVTLSPADRAAANYLYGGGSANPPLLAAAFTAGTIAGPAPLTVRFDDASLGGATGRAWAFGDGGTSALRNPVHTYAAPGVYTVALTASAAGYPDDTIRAINRIAVTGAAVLAVPGGAGVPTSTANDGLCDDVNGNGRKDFADVVLYFNQLSWIAVNEPVCRVRLQRERPYRLRRRRPALQQSMSGPPPLYSLSLATRNGVEQFTIRDLQQWTGWSYQKVRRVLIGRVSRVSETPGLLDKSPALSVLDRTTSEEDDEGRTATNRQFVFLFDPEVFRETRASGLVWLEPDGPGEASDSKHACCQTAVTSAVTSKEPGIGPVSVKGCAPGDSGSACDSNADHTKPDSATVVSSPKRCSSPGAVTSMNENGNTARSERSVGFPPSGQVTAGLSAPVTADVQHHDCCHFPDPRQFTPTGAPVSAGSAALLAPWRVRRLCGACYRRKPGEGSTFFFTLPAA